MRLLLVTLLSLFAVTVRAQNFDGLGAYGCMGAQVGTCQLKTAGGKLYGFQLSNVSGTAAWAFVMDTATVPVNGTINGCAPTAGPPCLLKAYQLSTSGATIGVMWTPSSVLFFAGLVIACSTTAPPTLTLSTTCLISGETQ
jgi:hypothetical protein